MFTGQLHELAPGPALASIELADRLQLIYVQYRINNTNKLRQSIGARTCPNGVMGGGSAATDTKWATPKQIVMAVRILLQTNEARNQRRRDKDERHLENKRG